MTISKKIIMVSCSALLLAGCASEPPAAVATEPDVVSIKLAQAADKASKALDTIANIEQQKNPAVPPLQQIQDEFSNISPNMAQPVSLRWSGPIEQVGRVLAERAGLRFHVKGRKPEVPLVVNVDAYQQPIIQVLRDIGLQAGSRADLSINQNEGVVEVRYAAADQSR